MVSANAFKITLGMIVQKVNRFIKNRKMFKRLLTQRIVY